MGDARLDLMAAIRGRGENVLPSGKEQSAEPKEAPPPPPPKAAVAAVAVASASPSPPGQMPGGPTPAAMAMMMALQGGGLTKLKPAAERKAETSTVAVKPIAVVKQQPVKKQSVVKKEPPPPIPPVVASTVAVIATEPVSAPRTNRGSVSFENPNAAMEASQKWNVPQPLRSRRMSKGKSMELTAEQLKALEAIPIVEEAAVIEAEVATPAAVVKKISAQELTVVKSDRSTTSSESLAPPRPPPVVVRAPSKPAPPKPVTVVMASPERAAPPQVIVVASPSSPIMSPKVAALSSSAESPSVVAKRTVVATRQSAVASRERQLPVMVIGGAPDIPTSPRRSPGPSPRRVSSPTLMPALSFIANPQRPVKSSTKRAQSYTRKSPRPSPSVYPISSPAPVSSVGKPPRHTFDATASRPVGYAVKPELLPRSLLATRGGGLGAEVGLPSTSALMGSRGVVGTCGFDKRKIRIDKNRITDETKADEAFRALSCRFH